MERKVYVVVLNKNHAYCFVLSQRNTRSPTEKGTNYSYMSFSKALNLLKRPLSYATKKKTVFFNYILFPNNTTVVSKIIILFSLYKYITKK